MLISNLTYSCAYTRLLKSWSVSVEEMLDNAVLSQNSIVLVVSVVGKNQF